MTEQQFDINQLKVAKPCNALWSEMSGDGQRRFCGQCKKNVYNVAGMSEREVRELVSKSEVLPCMRLARRSDGTVVTRDCPVGVAKFWQKSGMAALACLAFGFTLVGSATSGARKTHTAESVADVLRDKPLVGPVVEKLCPQPYVTMGVMVAGP